MRHLLHIMLLAVVLSLSTGCKDDGTNVVDHPTNPELVPTMTTSDVQTVISDSGHTRYRINAKLWNMYEEAKQPHWTFPEGVTCEELDDNYNTVTTIRCDSAYFDKISNLWTLTGHVQMTNATKDMVLTSRAMAMSPTSVSRPTSCARSRPSSPSTNGACRTPTAATPRPPRPSSRDMCNALHRRQ